MSVHRVSRRSQPLVRFFKISLALVLLILVLSGIAPASAQPGSPTASRNTLRANLVPYPNTLDPQIASFINEVDQIKLIYEGLTRLDESLNPAPGAAQSWTFNSDGTELTFTLRSGLKYSDGSLLNARRFEFSILRALDPSLATEYGGILNDITGAAAYRNANLSTITPSELAALKAAVAVHALDGSDAPCTSYAQSDCLKLQLHFSHPTVYFLDVASLWVVYPVKEEVITAGGPNWWQLAAFHTGNGPFILNTLVAYNSANFSPNPYYWRGQASYNVSISFINDSTAALQAYQSNQLNMVTPGAADAATIKNDPVLKAQFHTNPGSCTYAIMFNNKAPFTDIKVREAFTRSIDRQALVDQVLAGSGIPTLTWIPEGTPGYDPTDVRQSYNPAVAVQALNDSSYGGAAGLPPVVATYSLSPRNTTRWQWLANQWNAVLGVNVTLNGVDPAVYNELIKNQATAPQLYILGWCADYPDPQNWLSVYWHSGAFSARIGYSNLAVDALLELADSTTDPTLRLDRYIQAQHLILEDQPAAFLWNNMNSYLIKPYIKGYTLTSQDANLPGFTNPLAIYFDIRELFLPIARK